MKVKGPRVDFFMVILNEFMISRNEISQTSRQKLAKKQPVLDLLFRINELEKSVSWFFDSNE